MFRLLRFSAEPYSKSWNSQRVGPSVASVMFRRTRCAVTGSNLAAKCRAEILTAIARLPLIVLPVFDRELADAFQFWIGLLDRQHG